LAQFDILTALDGPCAFFYACVRLKLLKGWSLLMKTTRDKREAPTASGGFLTVTIPLYNLPVLHCAKCGYAWFPRTEKLSPMCPRCHSRHWTTPAQDLATG
jgi:hypothetical protein